MVKLAASRSKVASDFTSLSTDCMWNPRSVYSARLSWPRNHVLCEWARFDASRIALAWSSISVIHHVRADVFHAVSAISPFCEKWLTEQVWAGSSRLPGFVLWKSGLGDSDACDSDDVNDLLTVVSADQMRRSWRRAMADEEIDK